jgi:hypothetical protein
MLILAMFVEKKRNRRGGVCPRRLLLRGSEEKLQSLRPALPGLPLRTD